MTILAGQVLTASEWNLELLAGTAIARGSRPTSSTAASGATGVLRIDGVALIAGRRYIIRTSNLIITSSVAADRGTARLSMDTAGGTATTASTLYAIANSLAIDSTTDGCEVTPAFSYTPSANQTCSILLWTQRLSGTGNVRLLVTGSTTIDIEVIDMGVDIGDTGTDL